MNEVNENVTVNGAVTQDEEPAEDWNTLPTGPPMNIQRSR